MTKQQKSMPESMPKSMQKSTPKEKHPLLATALLRLAYSALHYYSLHTTTETERHNDLSRKMLTLLQGMRTRSKGYKEWRRCEEEGQLTEIAPLEAPANHPHWTATQREQEQHRKATARQKRLKSRLEAQIEGSVSYKKLLEQKNSFLHDFFLSAPIATPCRG